MPGTPAETARIPVGAVIVTFGGDAVDSPSTLTALMHARHPGDTVRIEWTTRQGRRLGTTLRLTEGPPQ